MKTKLTLKIFISAIIGTFLIVHLVRPDFKIDTITVALLALGIIPWLAPLVKSIELSGLGKVEFQKNINQMNEIDKKFEELAKSPALLETKDKNFEKLVDIAFKIGYKSGGGTGEVSNFKILRDERGKIISYQFDEH